MTELPGWVLKTKAMDRDGLKRVEEAVTKAELKTAGEIVPVLVKRSIVNALAPYLLALLFLVIALVAKLAWHLYTLDEVNTVFWSLLFVALPLLGFWLGHQPYFQENLLPSEEKLRQTDQRALLEFYGANLKATKSGTGILLFVSWQEHRAVVLADEGIAKHCQPEVFRDVVQDLIAGAKRKDIAGGFEAAIARSGELLAKHFPRDANDVNELRDHLIIRDH